MATPDDPATPALSLSASNSSSPTAASSVPPPTGTSEIQYDDVAIIGMSCRTAGGNDSPEKLWRFIMDKKDASGESPSWRWEPWVRRDTRNAKVIEKTISKGYFIEDLENFDASFFGISPKEAEQMDPHQRLGLEVTWEALEDAGINPQSLSGSDTAVYVGVDSDDYSRLLLEDIPNIEAWMGIGTTAHGIPNRISYHLDLMGPSAAVDAACASSMVAVHTGRQAILAGESRIAIVGGVNVCLSPALFHMLGAAGALSPDGVCLSFDEEARGYARGEGAAILILKKMSHAIMDGDHILATIKGSAIAQDGKTNGIMAPNAKAQELVARKALKQAGINALTVGYIEAHATSTPLGDPTEVSAISAVYGVGRPTDTPALIGSIKPNVGHLEAAAGAISLVKAVMAVQKGIVPPQTRLNKLNTRVDWAKSGLHVVRESTQWGTEDSPRRAAICSYGYGGTVSHAIIEQFAHAADPFTASTSDDNHPTLLLLSAPQGKQRLPAQSAALAEWISPAGAHESLTSIAATLATRRAHHENRAAFIVSSHTEAAETLNLFSKGAEHDSIVQSRTLDNNINKQIVWVFSGHGSHWSGMGKQLLQNAVFYRTVAPLDIVVVQELGYSAIEALKTGRFESSGQVQVLTYMTQIGLIQLLKAKGVHPHAVIGHSVGEIAASVAAGCLTPEEGMIIVTRRARLFAKVIGCGGMFLVSLPFAEVLAELGGRTDIVAAIDSSPSSCVISGLNAPLEEYVEKLKNRGIRVFQVKTDIAFHSPMLEVLSKPLKESLEGSLNPQPPNIKLYSTSQADTRHPARRDAEYWVDNMVKPVWLRPAVTAAIEDHYRIFMEVSTHPIVSHSLDETLAENGASDFTTIHTMKKEQSAEKCILHAVAQLWTKGVKIDFKFLGRQWSREVPKIRWSHKRFWKEVSTGSASAQTVHDPDKNNMLGQRMVVAGTNMTIFTTALDESSKPFPMPHQLHGTDIIPVSVYVNTFIKATGGKVLSKMELRVPLAVTNDVRNVQVIVDGQSVKVASRLSSSDDMSWVTHSTASWENEPSANVLPSLDVSSVIKRIGTRVSETFSVDYLKKTGVSGMAFPWAVNDHYNNTKEMLVTLDNDPEHETMSWDPCSWGATLDAATSVGATLFSREVKLRIVSHIDRLTIYSSDPPPKRYHLYVTEASSSQVHACSADISVLDLSGTLLARIESIRFTEVEATPTKSTSIESGVHQIAWVPARLSEKPLSLEQIVLVSEDDAKLEQYANELQRQAPKIVKLTSAAKLRDNGALFMREKNATVIYCPGTVTSLEDVASASHRFIWEVATAIKFLVENSISAKFFVILDRTFLAGSPTALAQGALYGLARVVASEHSDIWGGLIDNEGPLFPVMPLKYVQDQDITRYIDGVPRVARMRPFTKQQRYAPSTARTLLPKPEGTYVLTGGLGALGLETCDFLIEKGARRIVVISRRDIPARSQWSKASENLAPILERVKAMEKTGASIYFVSLDIGAADAHQQLLFALERLSLPPVLGVIHASGVLEDSLLVDTTSDSFARVLSPKISGALALHKAFPPGTLDFFVLYSSIGQLVGTSGQSSYAAGNSFLDVLAAHRRSQGDNAIAFQWTAWRGLGMATSTDFLTLELQSKGITDVGRDEAFQAWEHMSKYDVDQAVVTRTLALEADDILPCALLEEVVVRKARAQDQSAPASGNASDSSGRPTASADLKPWLDVKIRECVALVMGVEDIEEIDTRVPLSDYGVDSIMTIALRQKLQSKLKIKVPQTLMWNYPTVSAMVGWFQKQFEEGQ
ncbi:mellein synthase [Parastagonospora nodorum]|nr:mellein synthase [Parastagonospora nodorum]